MPTNRQLDHSFPAVLVIFGKGLNLPAAMDIQWLKCFLLQGASPLAPTPGALPPDPRYRLVLRPRHGAPELLTPSVAYNPLEKILWAPLATTAPRGRRKTAVVAQLRRTLVNSMPGPSWNVQLYRRYSWRLKQCSVISEISNRKFLLQIHSQNNQTYRTL